MKKTVRLFCLCVFDYFDISCSSLFVGNNNFYCFWHSHFLPYSRVRFSKFQKNVWPQAIFSDLSQNMIFKQFQIYFQLYMQRNSWKIGFIFFCNRNVFTLNRRKKTFFFSNTIRISLEVSHYYLLICFVFYSKSIKLHRAKRMVAFMFLIFHFCNNYT